MPVSEHYPHLPSLSQSAHTLSQESCYFNTDYDTCDAAVVKEEHASQGNEMRDGKHPEHHKVLRKVIWDEKNAECYALKVSDKVIVSRRIGNKKVDVYLVYFILL
jgi:hypothetical protein